MSFVRGLRCVSCGGLYPKDEFRYFCPDCGGFLDVVFDVEEMKRLRRQDFDARGQQIMRRWSEFLPIEHPELVDLVSLGESVTPLIHAARLAKCLGLPRLYIKDETRFPTGSLKDRSMPLVVLKALEFGFESVSIVSSGNAAASLSAYAAKAGLRAVVFVAGGASPRLQKCSSFGPTLIHVEVPYSEVEALFMKARDAYGWYDCNGLVNPYRLEGKKTLAHEVAQDLGWTAPDAVFMPVAFGNGLVSAWRGFRELNEIGWVSDRPSVWGVQPAQCAPIAEAFERGEQTVKAVSPRPTKATSIAVGDPSIGGRRVLEVARESGGGVVAADEVTISEAQSLLAQKEGLFVEPSGATGLAGVMAALQSGRISRESLVVVSITGEGLNDPNSIVSWARPPVEVGPDLESLRKALAEGRP